ncbi:histidine acid phosphatase [Colletotrichum gloeosporioides Cg-14]|uniref:Histidine acid phosphatase n=1 Tax=Colletotrichum gloeosporioides (strain Cg-14) TaxID=1237896 RepID=T0L1V1_COLGC|nr:histidine acid phosphatase [Colletotrichum gloeosporioides Cg-14]
MAGKLLHLLPLVAYTSASTLYSSYKFNPLEHLGGIAPYFEPQDPPTSPDAPQGCTASRAAYLVRHAAIYANDFDFEEYIEPFLEKLGNKTNLNWSKVPSLSFLADWDAPVSEAETSILTRVGRLEATQLGVDLEFRYPNLKLPQRVWTSSAERTYKSAQSLVRGLEIDDDTMNVVSIYESKESGADSLTPYKACPAYSSSAGSEQSGEFQKKFATPITKRLNALASDFNFTVNDVFGMQQLCGYETVIRGRSPFCDLDLFSPDDWLGWEYTEDIRYHYNVGYGNNVAPYVGMPWLNATANLLMAETADEDLYPGFGAAADINATFPLDRINYRRAWRSSNILSFLSNIAIERLNCTGSYGYEDGEYYRVLVNSSPQPLPDCADGPGTTCSRSGFETYIQDRVERFTGFSEQCGVEYDNSTDVMSIYQDQSVGNGTTVGKRYTATFQ